MDLEDGMESASATAGVTEDLYASNTALYLDPNLVEGVDYARRLRRHAMFDDDLSGGQPVAKSAIIAPHGGGIERGTSELCLAIAGYHPATLDVTPPGGVTYDYWMFEGLREELNNQLHVTSIHCDDGGARSLCGGALNALALHGCTTVAAKVPPGTPAVLVGGCNDAFKQLLLGALGTAGFDARDAAGNQALSGDDPRNIVNRTLLCMGGHLEITTPLRSAMFEVDTRADRKHTTTEVFWRFVGACRDALAQLEAGQVIL